MIFQTFASSPEYSNALSNSVQGNNSTCPNTSPEYVTTKFKSERFVSVSEIGLVGKI